MNNSAPKFSIITVCYNSEKYIEKTLLSLLNQTYKNFEYIVIDGQSTDFTIEILNQYTIIFDESDIVFNYVSEPDFGIYDAMNKGISMAKGEWICLINSDDFYLHNSLEILHSEIEKNPLADIIFGNLNLVNSDSNFIIELKPSLNLSSIQYTFSIFHPSMIIKRCVYSNVGLYDLRFKLSSDWDFTKKMYLQGYKFHYLDFAFANFRGGGAGSGFKKIHLLERLLIRHSPFRFRFLIFDVKDFLIYFYFKIFPSKSMF